MDRPYVIVDFQFEDGLLFLALQNIGERPAYDVSVKFKRKLIGLGGKKLVSDLSLFKRILFFAPQKTIRTLFDSSADFFGRGDPTIIKLSIQYTDGNKKSYQDDIVHDLDIYREIAFL